MLIALQSVGAQTKTSKGTDKQRAYVRSCSAFAWPDKVRCEVAPHNTLSLVVTENPNLDPDADDSMQYIIRHSERLAAIKKAGFDRLEFIVINGNGPGRNITTILGVESGGKFKTLQVSYMGTDGKMHCSPCE